MWTLECDGDLFNGKRIWLRPGSKLLFGRTKPTSDATTTEQSWAINNKSVSRKHLVIDVHNVEPNSADDLRSRTEIRLVDNSKLGTTLDGHKFKDSNISLSKLEHTVQLGTWEQKFFIKWQPVVLTPSMLTTKQKKAADPLSNYRTLVQALGIKLSLDYVLGQTTHVIANKRNSAKNLQALINGRYVITEAFIEAVVSAARARTSDSNSPAQAPLEVDFDANWPDPLDYIPAQGKEPVPRAANYYAPEEKRLDLFHGHTVIFFEQAQFDTLQDVVNNGGGKAVIYEVRADKHDVSDLVTFVNKLQPQKPIIVRFRGGEEEEQWKRDFQQASQLALSQRSIDQNEFLDAIITADINALKQPLQEEIEIASSMPPARSLPAGIQSQASQKRTAEAVKVSSSALQGNERGSSQQQQQQQQHAEPQQTTLSEGTGPGTSRRKIYRAPYKSKFTNIDEFDPSQITKYAEDSDDGGLPAMSQIEEELDEQTAQPSHLISTTTRKRPRETNTAPSDPMETVDVFSKVTSAHAEFKRRKLAASGASGTEDTAATPQKTPPKPKNAVVEAMDNLRRVREKREAGRDMANTDVKAEKTKTKARQAEVEEERVRQEEDLREQIGNADPSEVRARIQFEDMRISDRRGKAGPAPDAATERGERWDDRWNGRLNFKRFRKVRRGDDVGAQTLNRPRKVIVALEEARKKDFGLGEEYWLEPSGSSARREGSGRTGEHVFDTQESRSRGSKSQSLSAVVDAEQSAVTQQPSRPGSRTKLTKDSRTAMGRRVVEEEDSEPEDVELAELAGPPRKEKLAEKARRNESITNGKRKADAVPLPELVQSSNKKRTTTRNRRGRADDSSDDDLRFKFKKGA